ncbi:MAG: hypothetical protein HRT81_12165, partial [Henriciella sp.]|nr:hypothetical protein [Henriciella sp.]
MNWAFIAVNSLMAPLVFALITIADQAFRNSGIPRIPETFWLFAPTIVPALIALADA